MLIHGHHDALGEVLVLRAVLHRSLRRLELPLGELDRDGVLTPGLIGVLKCQQGLLLLALQRGGSGVLLIEDGEFTVL